MEETLPRHVCLITLKIQLLNNSHLDYLNKTKSLLDISTSWAPRLVLQKSIYPNPKVTVLLEEGLTQL